MHDGENDMGEDERGDGLNKSSNEGLILCSRILGCLSRKSPCAWSEGNDMLATSHVLVRIIQVFLLQSTLHDSTSHAQVSHAICAEARRTGSV